MLLGEGQWIPFDEDAINQFLGHPLVLKKGERCEFSQLLCVSGANHAHQHDHPHANLDDIAA